MTSFFWHDRHKAFTDFIAGDEEGGRQRIWACIYGCTPSLPEPSQLFLIHKIPDPEGDAKTRHHVWYIVEMSERDTETPIIYARTKLRRKLQIVGVPWVEPDTSRNTPQVLPLEIFSIWNVLYPNKPEIIVGWLVVMSGVVGFLYKLCKDDDDDFM